MPNPNPIDSFPDLYQTLQASIHDADTQDRFYHRDDEQPGELKLLQAVLQEAIERLDDATYMWKPTIPQAVRWVESDDDTYLCSFVNICEALGVSPSTIRKGLRAKYPQAWLSCQIMRAVNGPSQRIDYAATKLKLPIAEVVKVARWALAESVFKRKLPEYLWGEYLYERENLELPAPASGEEPVLVRQPDPTYGCVPGNNGMDLGLPSSADEGPVDV